MIAFVVSTIYWCLVRDNTPTTTSIPAGTENIQFNIEVNRPQLDLKRTYQPSSNFDGGIVVVILQVFIIVDMIMGY